MSKNRRGEVLARPEGAARLTGAYKNEVANTVLPDAARAADMEPWSESGGGVRETALTEPLLASSDEVDS